MFGEDLIIGHTTGKIDTKRRIFIPPFTKVEANEKLIIEKTTYDNDFALKIHNYKKYYKLIERMRELQLLCRTFEEAQKYEMEIEKLCIYLNAIVKTDTNKRIIIPNEIIKEFNWNQNEQFNIDGTGNSLLITQKK